MNQRSSFYHHHEKSNYGFTLIELLVVISIISLLSSIILTSLAGAKIKAQNNSTNRQIIQYINALELYRSDRGDYPNTGGFDKCLGTYTDPAYPGGACGIKYSATTFSGYFDASLKNALLPYLPTFSPVTNLTIPTNDFPPSTWLGATYRYNYNPAAGTGQITWGLSGPNQGCGLGERYQSLESSFCRLFLKR